MLNVVVERLATALEADEHAGLLGVLDLEVESFGIAPAPNDLEREPLLKIGRKLGSRSRSPRGFYVIRGAEPATNTFFVRWTSRSADTARHPTSPPCRITFRQATKVIAQTSA